MIICTGGVPIDPGPFGKSLFSLFGRISILQNVRKYSIPFLEVFSENQTTSIRLAFISPETVGSCEFRVSTVNELE